VIIRRELVEDQAVVRAVTWAAFAPAGEPAKAPVEAGLIDELRAGEDWLQGLSLVAVSPDAGVVGHVVCTRGRVDEAPVLGLGPISVRPDRQRRGVGLALMHAVLGAADVLGEPLVALLGEPAYYRRFGFVPATERGISPPQPSWGSYFQVRTLTAYDPALRGTFHYPEPFDRV
jgi:putative acetyltransferase